MPRIAGSLCALIGLSFSSAAAAQSPMASFHVVAHEDDWQLFFNPTAYADVMRPLSKVVFVYLTAGDAGEGGGPENNPYYQAREAGARRAVRFMSDVDSPTRDGTFDSKEIRGHRIARYLYKKTVSYFLRLPDGGRAGAGFPGTGQVSLEKLRTGAVNQLTALDGSSTYLGWRDLVDTLHALILDELQNSDARSVSLNIPDSSLVRNPHDHSDHVNVGRAMDEVAAQLSCASVTRYVGHHLARLRQNLSVIDSANKAAVFGVTVTAVEEIGCARCASTWRHHGIWMGKRVGRTTPGAHSQCFVSR